MSDLISSTVRMENFMSSYEWQKAQRFHGQLRVSLSSMLDASLGGLIGPDSNLCVMYILSSLIRIIIA
jgi:hypothetical protein